MWRERHAHFPVTEIKGRERNSGLWSWVNAYHYPLPTFALSHPPFFLTAYTPDPSPSRASGENKWAHPFLSSMLLSGLCVKRGLSYLRYQPSDLTYTTPQIPFSPSSLHSGHSCPAAFPLGSLKSGEPTVHRLQFVFVWLSALPKPLWGWYDVQG